MAASFSDLSISLGQCKCPLRLGSELLPKWYVLTLEAPKGTKIKKFKIGANGLSKFVLTDASRQLSMASVVRIRGRGGGGFRGGRNQPYARPNFFGGMGGGGGRSSVRFPQSAPHLVDPGNLTSTNLSPGPHALARLAGVRQLLPAR